MCGMHFTSRNQQLRLITGRYGAQTPFSDQLADRWVGGEWRVDATHNTIIAVTNAGHSATEAVLTFHYNHGQDRYEIRRTITAGDQFWLNLGDTIHGRVPDNQGRTFPPELTSGTYDLRETDRAGNPSLFEGKFIVDKTYGHLAYGCLDCCGYTATEMLPNPEQLAVQGQDQLSVQAYDACFDDWTPVTGHFSGWDSGNHSVAILSSNQITGMGVGSTDAFASGQLLNSGPPRRCPMQERNPANDNNVDAPHHLQVKSDTIGPLTACPTTTFRKISYQIVDASNTPVQAFVTIREQFTSKSANTCNTTIQTSESCSLIGLGSFSDGITVGCNSVGGSCGTTYTHQQWVWCANPPVVIATPGDLIIHNNGVSVGGNTTGFTPGTYIYP